MYRRNTVSNIILFLAGLFSVTQIRLVGSIGISEIPIYFAAPIIFIANYRTLKHDGFLPIIWLALLTCGANCISSYMNQTYIDFALRGFATPYSIFAVMVVLHRLLRNNLSGYKWLLLGFAFSLIVNVFIFQQSNEMDAFSEGATGVEVGRRIMKSSTIFWTSRIRPFIDAFIGGWYTQMPSFISVLIMFLFFVFSAVTTASGRSMAAATIGGVFMLIIGGKKKHRMRFFKRHFYFVVIVSIVGMIALSESYRLVAISGMLGRKAMEKYEIQMKEQKGVLGLLKGGRGEVFIGLTACIDKPIWGHGPWPLDKNDYVKRYYEKYGTANQWNEFISFDRYLSAIGHIRYHMIPGHSHIISFWLYYGVIGLVLWLYVLFLIFIYLKKYVDVVPQWFGYMAITIPLFLWSIFFSPYGFRVTAPLPICLILFSRAIAMGRLRLPPDMVQEAAKYD